MKIKFKDSYTKKQIKQIKDTLDMWEWLKDNPLRKKDEYPKFKSKIQTIRRACAFCQITDDNNTDCKFCELGNEGCLNSNSYYNKWSGADREKTARTNATRLYSMIKDIYETILAREANKK